MKPGYIVEYFVPIEVLGRCRLKRRTRPVVDDKGTALTCTLFRVIDAEPLSASRDRFCVDAEFAQFVERRVSHLVRGKLCDERNRYAEICQRNGNVRFRPSVYDVEFIRLHEAFVAFRREAQHDFSERDYLGHKIFQN